MKTRHSGFTLFELMMGIAIMGILVSLAVPSFQDYGRNTRAVAVQNDLVTALNYARSEAVRRSTTVSVCATGNFTSCGANSNWPRGWFAFIDLDADGNVDAADEILQLWRGPGEVDVEILASIADARRVTFTPTGLVRPAGSVKTYIVSSTACEAGQVRARRIQVNGIGSILNDRIACL